MTQIKFKGAPDQPTSQGKAKGGRSIQKMGTGISAEQQRTTNFGTGIKGPSATVHGGPGMKEANVYPGGTEARTNARAPITGSKGISKEYNQDDRPD